MGFGGGGGGSGENCLQTTNCSRGFHPATFDFLLDESLSVILFYKCCTAVFGNGHRRPVSL